MEWVEVHGKTVEVAVEAALAELGLTSPDEAEVEVIQEPSAGFLGLGGKEAIVKVSTKPKRPRQRRRRSGRGEQRGRGQRGDGGGRSQSGGKSAERGNGERVESGSRSDGGRSHGGGRNNRAGGGRGDQARSEKPRQRKEDRPESAPIETQAEVAKEFLVGLLDAFGLEGSVDTRIEEDVLWLDVTGGQTEALVGHKGAVMQAVHELTRTVIQRKTFGAPRMRLDIAHYAERRREALRIYTQRLADRLLASGGEIMLEPMNAADRKVVHDTVVEIPGVRSFSEGEDPDRAVVLALEEGYGPAEAALGEADEEIVLEPRDDGEEE
jgi:spoIIIJ-associated protein